MKNKGLIFGTLALGVGSALVATAPQTQFKRTGDKMIRRVANSLDVNPYMAKFMVRTKMGRKFAYLFAKNKLKRWAKS
jgi:hypothetical protein